MPQQPDQQRQDAASPGQVTAPPQVESSRGSWWGPVDVSGLDGLFTPEERDLALRVRSFVDDDIRPHIAEWFEAGHFPREIVPALGELGVLGMHLDGHGCAGRSAVEYGLAVQELEAGDSGLRTFVSVQGSLAMSAIHKHGSPEQKAEWLPRMATGETIGCFALTEPDSGSDPASMSTHARQEPGGDWVLNGTKRWIGLASMAEVAIVWAQTGESGNGRGVRGFVVPTDTPGFTVRVIGEKMSMRASVQCEIDLQHVRLPQTALLPEDSAVGLSGPFRCLSEARYGILWGAVGAARDSFTAALEYANHRTQFGTPLTHFQLTQAKLANMAVAVNKGYHLAHNIGRAKDASGVTPEMISTGKLDNTRMAIEVAREARTLLGGNGITLDYSPQRHANNLEAVRTYEGTDEVHLLTLGRAITGVGAFQGR
ncbi:MAG TPA: acyl-CoA dehydrogenase family protein [Candidatus Corynebacterium avicola]|uniref:glutaryl-CoA dehydrogenase (ETF) n=1 Tax=Candidatus Corynebacterium avicola TaxID=2838527 RepID=A0A9D1RNT9_9CORY|nr:acyl-CoA dehydrogenase family protein [Candidatus Corynebacterium avicola]